MDLNAISKAKARLRVARHQLARADKATNYEEFADCWYLFLVAAKNVYTTLEQGAKVTPQSRQWFGAKKNQRKSDPLLQYLFQARDDDEHGLGNVTKLQSGRLGIGKRVPGFSSGVSLELKTGPDGKMTVHNLKSLDGLPILVEETPAHAVLLPVTGRGGIVYNPPSSHLGQDLPNSLPSTVGSAGLCYLEALVAEAENRA